MKIVVDEIVDQVVDLDIDIRDIERLGEVHGAIRVGTKTANYVLRSGDNMYAARYGGIAVLFNSYSKLQGILDRYLG